MHKISFYLKTIIFLILSIPSFALEIEEDLNNKLTDLIRPNWPYEAFLAIPRISEMKPILSLEFSKEDGSLKTSKCIELFYLELQEQFDSEATLEREALHKLLCKAMKRSVQKTGSFNNSKIFSGLNYISLRFDFFNGMIKSIETPYPPQNPLLRLENVFLDESDVLKFGDIDLPEELAPEINQTPL